MVRPPKPISRARIETVLSRSVGGIALVFALQTYPLLLEQQSVRLPALAFLTPAVLTAAILWVVVATTVKRGIRAATGSVAIVYLIALVAWPLLMRDPGAVLEGKPWLWYLCTVATSCAAIAFPARWAAVYTCLAPVVYGTIRTLPSGGGADLLLAVVDVVYAVILGQVVLIIITMLRQATTAVDVAQANALQTYATAVRQHATEVERIEVDSIVHDTVLATLLSAAGVRNKKGADLAATMARNAIAKLDAAGAAPVDDEAEESFARLNDRIRLAAAGFPAFTVAPPAEARRPDASVTETDGAPVVLSDDDFDEVPDDEALILPFHASEALYSAAVQAMVNSVQHAGATELGVRRTLTMSADAGVGTIEIADDGAGFDPDSVANERLGLRVSIEERVRSAGGVALVRTGFGLGTTITLRWPELAGEDEPI